MSKIGDIYNSYGHEFNIAVANTSSTNVLSAAVLPPSTVIIAGERLHDSYEDIGKFSMIATDADGVPSRLTYCIVEGNGLHLINDSLVMSIDGSTLKTNDEGELYVGIGELADGTTISSNGSKLSIDVNGLPRASLSKAGVMLVDNFTMKSDNGNLYVDTGSLDLASGNNAGICIGDGTTVSITAGAASVIVGGLEKCSVSSFGVGKVDGVSTIIEDGKLSLNQAYFTDASHVGIVKADGVSIVSTNGVLSVSKHGLPKASQYVAGVVELGEEFTTNENGQTCLKESIDVSAYVTALGARISKVETDLDMIEDELNSV